MGPVSRGAAPDAKVAFTDLGNGTTNQIQTRQVRRGHVGICGRLKTHWSDIVVFACKLHGLSCM